VDAADVAQRTAVLVVYGQPTVPAGGSVRNSWTTGNRGGSGVKPVCLSALRKGSLRRALSLLARACTCTFNNPLAKVDGWKSE
jgi:hypothetical protein